MKLPNMALVFAIIIIPISLVFSTYVGYQVSTVAMQSTYDTRIVTATRDAIEALELNTFGDLTKDSAASTRRNIQASVNTFANSFASNFNVSGYDNSDVLVYVPALLFTMYDGYYIYAPTTENQADDDGYSHNKHVLKPYIYYSARYKSDDYDVVINYSLDDYITITGTVRDKITNKWNYVAKSGYLIDTSKISKNSDETKVTGWNEGGTWVNLNQSEELYENISFYEEDFNLDGYINMADYNMGQNAITSIVVPDGTTASDGGQLSGDPHKITLKCRYCYSNNQKYYYAISCEGAHDSSKYVGKWYTFDNTGHVTRANENTWENDQVSLLNDYSAEKFYQEAYDFSKWVETTFDDGIIAKNMIKPDGTPVSELTDPKDIYYIFNGDNTNILDAVGESSAFNQHKLSVMQNSIVYNLNVAISNYANASGIYDFALPEISENEWNKVLTNISMISFVQGMPIGFKTYNNYAIVTSTNNQMYVSDESIYYVINSNDENTSKDHHLASCSKMGDEINTGDKITGYPSTEFDMYTINYLTTGFIDENGKKYPDKDHYLSFYRHPSLDCYYCIVNKNSGAKDDDIFEMKRAKVLAKGRIKYNQYKVTQYINNKVH